MSDGRCDTDQQQPRFQGGRKKPVLDRDLDHT